MSNNSDLEIARIGAALQVLQMKGDYIDTLQDAAHSFLKRQFAEPVPVEAVETAGQLYVADAEGTPVRRCRRLKPTDNKIAHDLRCVLAAGHVVQCDFGVK